MPIDEKPSRNEDEYFTKQDLELIRARRRQLDDERSKKERSAHYMKCPKCGADLEEREHANVKIDVCPECGGTWLDAGELELLRHVQSNSLTDFVRDIFRVRLK
jgi:hypothetical protein